MSVTALTLQFEGLGLENAGGFSFAGHTLFLPAVSVGNVGQLATDLLLANLPEGCTPVKIGRIFHPALEAVVGSDIQQRKAPQGLMTSCEIFHSSEAKYVIVHFHAPVTMKGRQEFVDSLMNWIEEKKFEQVVCLSSVFASDRIDPQLVGIPFRFLSTDATPDTLLNKLVELEWKPIERREFPAPAVMDSSEKNTSVGILHLPGSGITKHLYESCQSKKLPFLALIMFASEGDNTPEALTLFQMADKVFGFRSPGTGKNTPMSEDISPSERDRLIIPISWTHFHEDSHLSLY